MSEQKPEQRELEIGPRLREVLTDAVPGVALMALIIVIIVFVAVQGRGCEREKTQGEVLVECLKHNPPSDCERFGGTP